MQNKTLFKDQRLETQDTDLNKTTMSLWHFDFITKIIYCNSSLSDDFVIALILVLFESVSWNSRC